MKNQLKINEIRKWVDENLPYFKLSSQGNDVLRVLYNGKKIEDWKKFEKFTGAIHFPLDFSSSMYVGVTATLEELQSAIELIDEVS